MNFCADFGASDEIRLTPIEDDKPKDAENLKFKASSDYFATAMIKYISEKMSGKVGDAIVTDHEVKRCVSASKKLNKLCKRIDNGFFNAVVFWCRVAYDGYERWNFKMHRHSFFEIHFVSEGRIVYDLDRANGTVVLEKEQYLLILPGTSHRIVSVDKGSCVFKLAFRIEAPAHILAQTENGENSFYTGVADACVPGCVNFMLNQIMNEKPGFDDAIKSQLSAFSIYVLQSVPGLCNVAQTDTMHDIEIDDRVRVIKQIIKDNIAEPLRSDDIARQVNISVRHLNRIIKQSDNMNLAELMRHMRIEKVKKLLAASHDSLDVIAEKTGFLSGSVLGRTFKSVEGCTPGQYRKDINT